MNQKLELHKVHKLALPISRIIEETADARSLQIRLPQDVVFEYYPGQFVTIWFEEKNEGYQGQKRAYSLSSSPTEKGHIQFSATLVEHGKMSAMLRKTKPGDIIHFTGPHGLFYYTPDINDVVLIGGGSGVTPLFGMLKFIAHNNLHCSTTWLQSEKTWADALFTEELNHLAAHHHNIKIVRTITRDPAETRADYHRRIDTDMLKEICGSITKKHFFVCGLPDFVNSILRMLADLDVPKEHLHYERF